MGTLLNRRRYMGGGSADEIIMTSASNAEVMAVCYAQGWAANADYMTKSEAEAVTSFGTAFRTSSISHFEELSYFTSITSIADNAFRGCASLTQMVVPNNITSIGSRAFLSCSSMTKIEIMGNITSVGASCFRDSSNLTTFIFHATTPPTFSDDAAFNSTGYSRGGIYVPDASVDAYKAVIINPYKNYVKPLSEYVG